MSKHFLLATLACVAITTTVQAQYYDVPPQEFTGPLSNQSTNGIAKPRMPYADGGEPGLPVVKVEPRMPYAEEDEARLWALEEGILKEWPSKAVLDRKFLSCRIRLFQEIEDLTKPTIHRDCYFISEEPTEDYVEVLRECLCFAEIAKRIPHYRTDYLEGTDPAPIDPLLQDTFISEPVYSLWQFETRYSDQNLRASLALFELSLLIAPDVLKRKADPGNAENLPSAMAWLLDSCGYLDYLSRITPTATSPTDPLPTENLTIMDYWRKFR